MSQPVTVIDVAPNLFGRPENGSAPEAGRRLAATVLHLASGAIDVPHIVDGGDDWIGLLVLDGLLLADLDSGRARTGWLVGGDDLIRPWDLDQLSLTQATAWRVLAPTRIALLDRDFSLRAGGLPILARALATRMQRTINWLLAGALVLASPVVEDRLLLAFALLGERWGRVTADGVLLRLPLTHALLATLCGVRRPSVTIALHSLAAADLVTRTADGEWLLCRGHEAQLKSHPSCRAQYADALGLGPRDAAAPGPSPTPGPASASASSGC